ncbi:hypothetical protein TNCV_3437591 [Trichonephila clavipes]|nr:hypothetical protein TNCV_3437591 [Trichonephila clavipes]
MGVMDVVICFNEGAYARTEVLKALKINPGVNTCKDLRKIDYVRICEAEMAVQKASKEARTTKRQIKRKQDALEQVKKRIELTSRKRNCAGETFTKTVEVLTCDVLDLEVLKLVMNENWDK